MLSIPFVSRNDDHGGQLLERIQGTLNSYIYYRDKYNWDIEIIFVEWNPPPNKPLIRDILTYPDNFPIKFIEVPPEMHNRYANSDKIALFSAIAMNVAMRRAKGNWVVSTTHDDIFSERLVTLLKNENFSEDSFYRAARYDSTAYSGNLIPVEWWCCKEKRSRWAWVIYQSRRGFHYDVKG